MSEEVIVIQIVITIFFGISTLLYKNGNLDKLIFQGISVVFAIITIIDVLLLIK